MDEVLESCLRLFHSGNFAVTKLDLIDRLHISPLSQVSLEANATVAGKLVASNGGVAPESGRRNADYYYARVLWWLAIERSSWVSTNVCRR